MIAARRGLAGSVLAGVAVGGLVAARRRFMLVTVRGTSMTPAYADGERVLVRRGGYAAGDVVVFRPPVRIPGGLEWLVKRVAAMPGDPVPADMAGRAAVPVVPPGALLVRSDAGGLDSRQLGLIDGRDVAGKVCSPRRSGAASALAETGRSS